MPWAPPPSSMPTEPRVTPARSRQSRSSRRRRPPRQNQIGWIDSFLNGGVTTMISAGEVHMPGRPRDIVGVKAMAIFAQRAFEQSSPRRRQGPCRRAGIERNGRGRFQGIGRCGVKLLGEVGLGGAQVADRKMVAWAPNTAFRARSTPAVRRFGLRPDRQGRGAEADTDVIGHINGGYRPARRSDPLYLRGLQARSLELVRQRQRRARRALYVADRA